MQQFRYPDAFLGWCNPSLLSGDPLGIFNRFRIMSQDLALNTVFQWSDDASPVGIIFRVGGEDKLNIQRQTELKAPDLNVAFLQDNKERDLDPCPKARKRTNHKNA